MSIVINGSGTITGATTMASQSSFATTIGVGGATPSASGAGITFPATQSASSDANTLDDYEEGTWTPTFSATGYTFTYSSQNGLYTKIGNTVFFKMYMVFSVSSGSGSTQGNISGLPFTSANNSANFGGVSINPDTGSAYLTTGGYTMTGRTSPNSTQIPFYVGNGGNALKGLINWAGMTASTEFEISGHYFV